MKKKEEKFGGFVKPLTEIVKMKREEVVEKARKVMDRRMNNRYATLRSLNMEHNYCRGFIGACLCFKLLGIDEHNILQMELVKMFQKEERRIE